MSLQLLHLHCYVHWGSQRRFVYTASHPSSSLWQALASSQQTTLLPGILRLLVCVGGIVNSTCFTTIQSLTKHYLYMTSLAGILILSSLLRYGKILGLSVAWTLLWWWACCYISSWHCGLRAVCTVCHLFWKWFFFFFYIGWFYAGVGDSGLAPARSLHCLQFWAAWAAYLRYLLGDVNVHAYNSPCPAEFMSLLDCYSM